MNNRKSFDFLQGILFVFSYRKEFGKNEENAT